MSRFPSAGPEMGGPHPIPPSTDGVVANGFGFGFWLFARCHDDPQHRPCDPSCPGRRAFHIANGFGSGFSHSATPAIHPLSRGGDRPISGEPSRWPAGGAAPRAPTRLWPSSSSPSAFSAHAPPPRCGPPPCGGTLSSVWAPGGGGGRVGVGGGGGGHSYLAWPPRALPKTWPLQGPSETWPLRGVPET